MMTLRRTATLLPLLFALLPFAALADGASKDETLSPYFLVEGDANPGEGFPLESTDVDFDVSGVVGDFTVTQTYRNRGSVPLHAQYVFPASTRAAVHGLTLKLDDRTIEAKVKERGEARADFERAKKEGKAASLLEQDRPNVFRMNVANILPGEKVQVVLKYSELLVPTDGVYELMYPTVVGPRYSNQTATEAGETGTFLHMPYLHAGRPPPSTLRVRGVLSTGVPLEGVESGTHRVRVQRDGAAKARVELEPGEAESAGNRDFILKFRLRGDEVRSGLLLSEGTDERFFLLMVQPPRRVEPSLVPPREYVFIVDVSGSMRGFPLETAKKLVRELADGLRPQDRFNVLLFSGDSRLMSPVSVAGTPENVARALSLIDGQAGGGGTELLPAMQRALTLPRTEGMARTFVAITDGYISTEKALFDEVRRDLGDANVFCFGIGSSVNRYLVEGIAKAGQGEPFMVVGPEHAQAEAERFAAYVRSPVLTHVKLRAEGFDIFDAEPSALPDVLADRPIVVQGKWRGARKGKLVLTGTTGLGPYSASFDVAAVQPSQDNAPLRYLWARSRIAALSDFSEMPDEATKAEVVRMGIHYNLLTRFTSFIAVSEQVRTATPGQEVDQPLPMPEGVEDSAVGTAQGAEPELWMVLLVALAVSGAVLLASRRE